MLINMIAVLFRFRLNGMFTNNQGLIVSFGTNNVSPKTLKGNPTAIAGLCL